jgi:hypothetical protein
MKDTQTKVLEIMSICLSVVTLVLLVVLRVSYNNDIGKLDARISQLEQRQQ